MRRLSSTSTFFNKRVFPVIWFGALGLFFAGAVVAGAPWPFLLAPPLMAVFGYFLFKMTVFDLVDEVWDDGDALVVRNKGIEQRVPFSEIMNVSSSEMHNPPRITLLLRKPCRLGREFTFSLPLRWWPFSRHPLVNELIERADEVA
jgi:hypothetical protein